MHKVIIGDKVIEAEAGAVLSEALAMQGFFVEHPCGGLGICKKCRVQVNGKEELACRYRVNSDIRVVLPEKEEIVSETGAAESGRMTGRLCLVLDIGTTTLALAAVSLDEKKIIRVVTAANPQRAFGADVISRIEYCRKHSVEKLHETLLAEVNRMLQTLQLPFLPVLYVSGNTTMLHTFFNVDCSSLGVFPYQPAFLESRQESGEELGICSVGTVISLPSISAFVGADIVAGLNYIGMPEEGRYRLLVDLGTNAEIVLFSRDTVLCTAAAAGPCFEGANISCGMSATPGAIYEFFLDENRQPGMKTIGNEEAKGICGTGLVDLIAALLAAGIIDETGYMECENYPVTERVLFTQADVRQYQLAKSAVCSAIASLMKVKDISFDRIEKMYISGGFSAKINIPNAVKTGLLPGELMERCEAINNSSLLGTARFACEENDLSVFLLRAEYVDLSANAFFADLFMENMGFEAK